MEPNTLDGLKIITDTCSILIRPSNTEPIIRLYIETSKMIWPSWKSIT